ncbi:MAG TPA: sulfatase-like hydrolase/transferase, partial [Saprospiraceae bacterium]|nr:sulfatase-like hydrolase/transferase [Saprospiraceae bacterium]
GTEHMRSRHAIPSRYRPYVEYLRHAGYYCTNNQKTDYQFAAPLSAWDENGPKAHWRNRPKGTPFFSVFNINTTHESKLWENAKLPLTVQAADVPVPPYLPDNEATRATVARHYSNVELMDAEFGAILQQLKDDGLLEQTIIFFYSDHG